MTRSVLTKFYDTKRHDYGVQLFLRFPAGSSVHEILLISALNSHTPRRLMNVNLGKLSYRVWYYFRMGYSTYLSFLIGYGSTLVTVYYLAIKNVPPLLDIFPKFWPFAILSTLTAIPLSVILGWFHMKRSLLYSSEVDVTVESYPYNYKLPPGFNPEVVFPAYLVYLKLLRRLAEQNGFLTEGERAEIEQLENKFDILIKGGWVGTPRRIIP